MGCQLTFCKFDASREYSSSIACSNVDSASLSSAVDSSFCIFDNISVASHCFFQYTHEILTNNIYLNIVTVSFGLLS